MKAKRLTTLLLALVMAFALAVPASARAILPFTDVEPTSWYYHDVDKAWIMDLINGRTATTFAPDANMTYAEAVKLAACMHQKYTTGSVTLEVGSPTWYATYVDYAKANSILSQDYAWNKNATRADYVDIFSRALPDEALAAKNSIAGNSIPDVKSDHPQAAAIYKMYRAGIVIGSDKDGTFHPDSNIRRCEVAAILTRMMDPAARQDLTLGEETVPDLKITAQPKDVTVAEGGEAVFTVAVTGGKAPYSYQWSEITPQGNAYGLADGTENYSGTKTASLTVQSPAVRISESGTRYCCYVYDASGTEVISAKATLTVTAAVTPLEIAAQPADVTAAKGADATFTVTAAGGKTPYTYEWRRIRKTDSADMDLSDWTYLSGSNTAVLTVKNLVLGETGDMYYCIITDANNKTVTSGRATLNVLADELTITSESGAFTVDKGVNIGFEVKVSGGKAPYTFQWYYCNPGDAKFYRVEEAAEWYELFDVIVKDSESKSILGIREAGTKKDQNGSRYYCVVTDADNNSAASSEITLHVRP